MHGGVERGLKNCNNKGRGIYPFDVEKNPQLDQVDHWKDGAEEGANPAREPRTEG